MQTSIFEYTQPPEERQPTLQQVDTHGSYSFFTITDPLIFDN